MVAGVPGVEAQLFVVHVWRHRARFRAAVRRVDAEETVVFRTPTRLADYLAKAAIAAAYPKSTSEVKK